MALEWDALNRTWRSGGKRLTNAQKVAIRNDIAEQYARYIEHETRLFQFGKIEYSTWRANVADYMLKATGNGFTFGRGGVDQMTNGDYDRLARVLNKQLGFFDPFADEVLKGDMSLSQMMQRAMSYSSGAIEGYEQGQQGAALGDDEADWELPFYPGDGDTECLFNCRCAWEINEDEYGWTCTYHAIGDDRICADCEARERQYGPGSPLEFPKRGAGPRPVEDMAA